VIASRSSPPPLTEGNLGLRVLAVFLSIFLWGFVRFTQTPFSATISQADIQVPLDLKTDDDMAALNAPGSVTITVRGSRDAIGSIEPNAIAATVDLRGKTEGLLFPRVTVIPPPDLSVVTVQPERLSIRLVPIITQSYNVEARLSGHVAQGYSASPPTLRTSTATVKGPKTAVQTVKSVYAVITLDNTETGIMQRVQLEPRDEDGNPVHNVEISPASEIVTVNVTPAIVPRLLPVFPAFTGSLAKGLRMNATWTPRMLALVSPRASTPPAAVFADAIDVTRLRAGEHRFSVKVVPPKGATLVKEKEIAVVVHVSALEKAAAGSGAKKPPASPSR
jgi:YbbR domain-containing protein